MEWLKDVKIGDKVIVEKRKNCYKNSPYFELLKVKNITKSGKIRLEDDSLFTNGYYIDRRMCMHHATWINCSLLPAIEENMLLLDRISTITYLNNFNFGNIRDTKFLQTLKDLIQEKLEEEKTC